MIEFLRAIGCIKDKIKVIDILHRDKIHIKDSVIKSLGVKDEFKLNDRYDGVAFYNNFFNKVMGVIAIEKFLKIRLIDWSIVNPKTYKPIITINGQKVLIHSSIFGEMPELPKYFTGPIIILVKKDDKTMWVIGLLNVENRHGIDNLSSFDNLETFNTYDELKSLISK